MLLSQPRDQSYDVQSALSETSRFDPTSNSKVEHNIHGDHHNFLGSRGRWRHVLSCLMVFIQTLAELGASQNCLYYSREYKTYSFLPPPKRVQKYTESYLSSVLLRFVKLFMFHIFWAHPVYFRIPLLITNF